MSHIVDFAQHIEPVARQLYGEPNAELSTKTELRFGTYGSLAVKIGGANKGTWFDHESKVGGGVLDLLHHKLGLANGAAVEWLEREVLGAAPRPQTEAKGKAKTKGKIVAEYDYTDADGKPLFQVVRKEPKAFLQRRRGEDGNWVWKKGTPVPYRLPALIAAVKSGRIIYVPEGEKDVNNLNALGFEATCNPGGAGKWLPEFAQHFAGADVVILPDNDEAGQKHKQDIAANLAPVARRVRVLELPGLPPKGDVSDWIQAGGTRDALMQLTEAAPSEAEGEKTPTGEAEWKAHLLLTPKGNPKPLLANAITAFRLAPEWQGRLWFDEFHQRAILRGTAPWMTDAPADQMWTSHFDILAANWLQHHGITVTPNQAGQAVNGVARDRTFHPVRDYLGALQWDGEPRLDIWAVRYLGVEDTPYVRAVASRWMISAVARVMEPGCKADCALILEGDQGLLKSTALKTLGVPWFTDEVADLGTKDAALQVAGIWLLELAELDSMSRGDVGKIKAFMSRSTDRFRPPYEPRVIQLPRQCVFAGTVNNNEYLRDETGGRRFWPITCTEIDIEGLKAARDQLWAEARDRYLAGEPWWLNTVQLTHEAAVEQEGRYQADVWQDTIAAYVDGKSEVTVEQILRHALRLGLDQWGNVDVAKWGQAEQNRVARCLRALKWKRHQIREGKKRRWAYSPPSPVSPDEG